MSLRDSASLFGQMDVPTPSTPLVVAGPPIRDFEVITEGRQGFRDRGLHRKSKISARRGGTYEFNLNWLLHEHYNGHTHDVFLLFI